MRSRFVLSTVMLVVLGAMSGCVQVIGPMDLRPDVAFAQLAPIPDVEQGALRDWTVGLIARDGAQSGGDDQFDDLSLMTVLHLAHFIESAGGKSILPRRDRTFAGCDTGADRVRELEALRAVECDVILEIAWAGRVENAGTVNSGQPRTVDGDLLASLAGELPWARMSEVVYDGLEGVPVYTITLPANSSFDVIGQRRECLDTAWDLYQALASTRRLDSPNDASETSGKTASRAAQVAQRIWPRGDLPRELTGWFCYTYVSVAIRNNSLAHFDVAVRDGAELTLVGRTTVPHVLDGLRGALRAVGVDVPRSEVVELPNRTQLRDGLFGVCRVPMALTYRRPHGRGGVQTQLLRGEAVFLLDREDGHFLLHAADGYWGWIPTSAIEPMAAAEFAAYCAKQRTEAESGCAADAAKQRVWAALNYLYVPYVFGGRSELGVDCSGVLTRALSLHGALPARDAWQQAFAGRLVATAWHRTGIQAGDQLFFMGRSGKIYHTALALSPTRFIHASPPCVQVGSFDAQDPLYDATCDRYFFMAKRP